MVVSALRSPTVERRSGKRRAGKKCCLVNKLVKRVLGVSNNKNHLLPERTEGKTIDRNAICYCLDATFGRLLQQPGTLCSVAKGSKGGARRFSRVVRRRTRRERVPHKLTILYIRIYIGGGFWDLHACVDIYLHTLHSRTKRGRNWCPGLVPSRHAAEQKGSLGTGQCGQSRHSWNKGVRITVAWCTTTRDESPQDRSAILESGLWRWT